MSFHYFDYKILPSSIAGDNIVARDFKDKTVLFRVEINTLIDQEFHRDNEWSGYDTTYETNMYIITEEIDDYIFHSYYGGTKEQFERHSNRSFCDTAVYNYDKSSQTIISSLESKIGSYNFRNQIKNFYSIARMSKIEPLIKSLKTLLTKEKKLAYKKQKAREKAYQKYLKSKEYYQSNFGYVLIQLKKVTHCPVPNCKKFDLDFNIIKKNYINNLYFRDYICKECCQKGCWSI